MLKYVTILLTIFWLPLAAQIPGFSDHFEDGALDTTWNGELDTLWGTWDPGIFDISEANGVLLIAYTRTSSDREWPAFYFVPPEVIDVSVNPKIVMLIKSDVSLQFAIKPVYTNGNDNYQSIGIAGDDSWHTYTFSISGYSGGYLNQIVFHFDGGSTPDKQGTVYFDDFKIAGFSVSISNLSADFDPENQVVNLSWDCDWGAATEYYRVYRDTLSGFTCNSQTLIGDTTQTVYRDRGLSSDTWYYKVTAVDTTGEEHAPSSEESVRTYTIGTVPIVEVADAGADTVGRYAKLEIILNMEEASYANPYNPEEIDVYACFLPPEGDTIRVNAFYDNYNNVDEWKVRFSPDTVGQWEYRVFARDIDGTGTSARHTFMAVESAYHGCLNVSTLNSRYLIYHDGTPFYGIGAYYPWNVENDADGLGILAESGGNIFGYWNGNYDNAGNGGGAYQIESARTGIGYYDQSKCARIDEILAWAEQRNLKMMFAIWPHDVLDKTVWGYAGWYDNAFREICTAAEFYSDSLSWEYQKKLYRYIIARWGYSRSLGIWEFVNEINGTDGWAYDSQSKALDWIGKIQDYFKASDYFNRPTTISKSGGAQNFWPEGYAICDLPNVHLYETGWPPRCPDDPIRSSYLLYQSVARQLWSFNKPAIFGEAGATPSHLYANNIEKGSAKYVEIYHNAIWAAWSAGLAATPIWWEMNDRSLMTDAVFAQLKAFAQIAGNIDYTGLEWEFSGMRVDSADASLMEADTTAFGWVRSYRGSIAGREIRINELASGTFKADWYDTWTGELIRADTCVSVVDMFNGVIPELEENRKDVALKLARIADGTVAARLNLFFEEDLIQAFPDHSYTVVCYVSDDANRFCPGASNSISFSLSGPGELSTYTAEAANGIVVLEYIPTEGKTGGVIITAESEGLTGATLETAVLTDINDREESSIPQNFTLKANYPNPFNAATLIEYAVPKTTNVRIDVYNLKGQLVETLVDDKKVAGNYQLIWTPRNLPSGVYLYRMTCDQYTMTRKGMFLK